MSIMYIYEYNTNIFTNIFFYQCQIINRSNCITIYSFPTRHLWSHTKKKCKKLFNEHYTYNMNNIKHYNTIYHIIQTSRKSFLFSLTKFYMQITGKLPDIKTMLMTGEITLIRETSLQVLALFNQLQKDVKVSWRFLHIKSIWLKMKNKTFS